MSSKSLLLLLCVLVLAAGGFVFSVLGAPPARVERSTALPGAGSVASERAREPASTEGLVAPSRVGFPEEGDATTTVLWPLRVELELVRANHLPETKDTQPIGSGAKARLSGAIRGPNDAGVRAEIEFVAGPNAGRVLYADGTGGFGASDLLPGLSIVVVRGEGIPGSRRQVRLRQNRETLLNIGYGRPGSVFGRVVDREGNGIDNASVLFDGTRTRTNANGDFQLASVGAGPVLVEVEKEGYALHQSERNVTGGAVTTAERLTIQLEEEASAIVTVTGSVTGGGPTQVMLFPGNFGTRSVGTQALSFPWHRVQPIEVFPGQPTRVDGLPAEVVRVFAFRPGAKAAQRVANLRSGGTFPIEIRLEPAPRLTGVVTFEGEPVANALVRLEAPNQVRAMLSYFREPSYFLELAAMPTLPPARQEVRTDPSGAFVLTSWAEVSPARYLEVIGPGSLWAGQLVREVEGHLELELSASSRADGALTIGFPGRHQGLPIEVLVNGAPMDPAVLPTSRPLELDGLVPGIYRVQASWHGMPVFDEPRISVDEDAHLVMELPPEALEGQDEEAWRRAGRLPPE